MKFSPRLRHVLALVFSVSCNLAVAQHEPIETEFVFEIRAEIVEPLVVGESLDGHRQAIPITGGDFKGPDIEGEIIPGGADYQWVRPDGVRELTAVYMMRTDDGAVINVENHGIISQAGEGVYFRTAPKFQAPVGPYDWLNKHLFLSSITTDPAEPGVVRIRVYKVL